MLCAKFFQSPYFMMGATSNRQFVYNITWCYRFILTYLYLTTVKKIHFTGKFTPLSRQHLNEQQFFFLFRIDHIIMHEHDMFYSNVTHKIHTINTYLAYSQARLPVTILRRRMRSQSEDIVINYVMFASLFCPVSRVHLCVHCYNWYTYTHFTVLPYITTVGFIGHSILC